jgi:glycerol-3-phosphate acyltransferase PlsX
MAKGNNSTTRNFKRAVIRGTRFLKKHSPLNFLLPINQPLKKFDEIIVAVDVMGGDNAPHEIVKGAVRATRELGIKVQLVGPADRISRELSRFDIAGLPLEIVDAPDFISMEEKQPVVAVRRKPDSSIMVTMKQVASGQAHAAVSAGSTGAAATAALFHLKRIPGIERPGIAAVVPNSTGEMILVDAGANVDSTPSQMAQHAIMGSLFASGLWEIESPRVGLLNIGEEPGKGNQSSKHAFEVLDKLPLINFVGNVEGRTLSENYCDVLVADGFVGNIFLKTVEGSIKMAFQILHQELTRTMDVKMGALVCKPAFIRVKQERLNYAQYGGAVLMGVQGVVVIAHGISNDFAILNAIRLAAETARSQIVDRIKQTLQTEDIKSALLAAKEAVPESTKASDEKPVEAN